MKHKILFAVDGEKTSWSTAKYVGRACAGKPEIGSGVIVFHVLPPVPVYTMSESMGPTPQLIEMWKEFERETQNAAIRMLVEIKQRIRDEGVEPEFITTEIAPERGSVVPQILEAARNHNCDTIVVGRRGKHMMGQFFLGGVVEHLLRHPTGFTIWVVE